MSNYLPALQFLVAGASTLALSYFNKRLYDTSGQQSASQKLLNFSIIEDTKKELLFGVKPLPEDQYDKQDEKEQEVREDFISISAECDTAVLIKINKNKVYGFVFINFRPNTEDRNSLIRKINKIIYRLHLFDILKDEEYIYVTIDCKKFRTFPGMGPHQDQTLNLNNKIENASFSRDLLTENIAIKFIMMEYKSPCMAAQFDYGEEHFRCSIEPSQILCFNNLLGEHTTPGILKDHEFREEGNRRVGGIRTFERYYYSPINKMFYYKYKNAEGMTFIQHDISTVSEIASSIRNTGEKILLSEYTQEVKERKESGGSKTKKYKIKTNKYKIKVLT